MSLSPEPDGRSSVVSDAKQLLSQNQLDKARERLLEAGFTKQLDPEAQQAFSKLIPLNEDLETQLAGSICQLRDPDPKVRRNAARRIRTEAMKEVTPRRK